ncbi:ribonuclease D [Kytococcus aerolatus]|uniref:Ribonuclease D n=1 Tax=Kytococcus aerolatus TaxID=592308 RepID=A0A212T397_9MICO|nr:HRDC domain-containing protein [Kytococcus aerolatus]SNC60489.1 ribonuclease D [Kytococcus aerolatus]
MPTPLNTPAEPLPEVVADDAALVEAAERLAAGTGPVAVDAERAAGYRYGNAAYLVQLRRTGAGTVLVDPTGLTDTTPLAEALDGPEWVLHAATQDLPCLAELGLRPRKLFDTELGARLAGLPRVGLAAVVEHYLDLTLAKEHSAVDWSTRPLPTDWLLYAALDVEVLVELRAAMAEDLARLGRGEWARQEFDHLLDFRPKDHGEDAWRRTSGSHRVRRPRQAAVLRELWQVRDAMARERDVTPSKVVTDDVLVALATAPLVEPADMAPVARFAVAAKNGGRRGQQRRSSGSAERRVQRALATLNGHRERWWEAVERGRALPEEELPPARLPATGPPPAKAWADRDPEAAERLTRAREELGRHAESLGVPLENLLTPSVLREVLWCPPQATDEAVDAALAERGARPWQRDAAVPVILRALAGPSGSDEDRTPEDA